MSISSQIITVNSKYHHKCPYKKEAAGDKHQTSGGETLWRQAEGDVLCCQGAAITTTNSRRQGEDYPLSLQWKTGPAEPYFQTFGLQNCEIIHFYHYKPQICVLFFFCCCCCCFLLQQRIGTNCRHCSVAKLFPTLCNPMYYSMPGFPVVHYLPEFAQVHVH